MWTHSGHQVAPARSIKLPSCQGRRWLCTKPAHTPPSSSAWAPRVAHNASTAHRYESTAKANLRVVPWWVTMAGLRGQVTSQPCPWVAWILWLGNDKGPGGSQSKLLLSKTPAEFCRILLTPWVLYFKDLSGIGCRVAFHTVMVHTKGSWSADPRQVSTWDMRLVSFLQLMSLPPSRQRSQRKQPVSIL